MPSFIISTAESAIIEPDENARSLLRRSALSGQDNDVHGIPLALNISANLFACSIEGEKIAIFGVGTLICIILVGVNYIYSTTLVNPSAQTYYEAQNVNGTEQICTPIKAIENGDQLFFSVLYKNKEKVLKSSRISGIEVLSDKYVPRKNSDITVTYKMKAQLAKRYSLRENENILQTFDNGDITVSNYGEVKEILFSRLLRYADLCEILTPKIYREEIKLLLDNTLSNYGEKI